VDWREKYRGAGKQTGPEELKGPGDTVFPGKFRRKVEWAEYKCKDRPRQHNSPSGSKTPPDRLQTVRPQFAEVR
jgi:hypothetical protein